MALKLEDNRFELLDSDVAGADNLNSHLADLNSHLVAEKQKRKASLHLAAPAKKTLPSSTAVDANGKKPLPLSTAAGKKPPQRSFDYEKERSAKLERKHENGNGLKKRGEERRNSEFSNDGDYRKVIWRPTSSSSSSSQPPFADRRIGDNGDRNYQAKAGGFKDKERKYAYMSERVKGIYAEKMLKLEQQRLARQSANQLKAAAPNNQQLPDGNQKAASKDQQQRRHVNRASNDQTENGNRSDGAFNYQQRRREIENGNRSDGAFNHQQRRRVTERGNQARINPPGRQGERALWSELVEQEDENGRANSASKWDAAAAAAREAEKEERYRRWKQRQLERKLDAQPMTLQVYEKKKLEQKRAPLETLKSQQLRVVTLDKDFESMRIIEKKNQESIFMKSNSESHDKVNKKKATLDINGNKALITNFTPGGTSNYSKRSGGGSGRDLASIKPYEEVYFPAIDGSTKE